MRVKQLESAATAGSGAPSGPGRIVLWRAGDGGRGVSWGDGEWGRHKEGEPGKKMKKNHPGGNLLHCGKKQYYKSLALLNSAGN